ncbi:MAG: DNA-directed RNA polymerase subunit beta [candidate division WS6 bacterium 34_10]|uniref:DNA-directed RNA polymerase subunit beta' n=1 Tax=candidate division WS6 bacterium 34_10 TaxID=1641389 RepID=A0A101HJ29_9BACT|nr:MAG: DNA-directed RNA polymerase subunit beta [candidate division WS6 bacterium 34_10]
MNKRNTYSDFDALKLTLASPEQIRDWSYGEVTKAETINYRTFKAEPDGLFCEKIFGPTKNYECYCGKYKKIRYKGIVCDKCGVEVTTKDVRRERMGHIKLAVPVAHVWFAYGVPNKMSIVLNMPHKKLLSVIYYTRYMVVEMDTEQREDTIKKAQATKKDELEKLDKELEEEIKEATEDYDKEIKEAKDEKADEFKISQLKHKKKQGLAQIHREFAEREEDIENYFNKLITLLETVEIGSVLTEDEYVDLQDRDLLFFEAQMGAQAIKKLLEDLDVEKEVKKLRKESKNQKGSRKASTIKRLQYLEGFLKNNTSPTWMVVDVLPVLPPELRPIIPLSGGKFATSDLNDLYRRIINRNNRLARLIEIGAPEVILRNEKRMLQESVDALIDNSHRPSKPMLNSKRLPYQSLTDDLRGKKGIFRKNLLGKRVDYSGRAVIDVDPNLSIDQCGLPKAVALEMFKPFVIHELLESEDAPNIRIAKEMIDNEEDVVWDYLEKVIEGKPVLLNRAPTLHKYSIQGFYPKLVEGDAIRIHPLVCKAFNADFDGDQMAVHVLLTDEALEEAKKTMMASANIVNISNSQVLATPSKDMLLGFFLMTDLKEVEKPRMFASDDLAIKAYERDVIEVDEEIVVKINDEVISTSVGRVIFNSILPEGYSFLNERIGVKKVREIAGDIKDNYEWDVLVETLDSMKALGFKYATDIGFTMAPEDAKLDFDLEDRIAEMEKKDEELQENYLQGLITEKERISLSTTMWNDFASQLADEAWEKLDRNNPIYEMVESGANGGKIQARQVLTIKGMVRDSRGNWVPLPIKGNYRDGLSAFEYFVAANGGRKGIADRSLRTSSTGYLTRKLVDVAHDVIVRDDDCGYEGEGLCISKDDERRMSFGDRMFGRILAQDVKDGKKVIAKKNEAITRDISDAIEDAGIEGIYVRSPILCKSPYGICEKCYGLNLENGEPIGIGRAVGVIAAQSIGEPGTQMTMRTFHKGGVASVDITQGVPRIEELFEARKPKSEAEIASVSGKVHIEYAEDDSATVVITGTKKVKRHYIVSDVKEIMVEDGDEVKAGQIIYIDKEGAEKQAPFDGMVSLAGGILDFVGNVKAEEVITVLPNIPILVKEGEDIKAGRQITEGSVDPKKLTDVAGMLAAQKYILDGVQKVFNEQGVAIGEIHIEVILRQMARLGRVIESGDSEYLVGSLINRYISEAKNESLVKEGKNKALVIPKLLGIKGSALHTESFLSAMSFQEQVRVLTQSAILGKVDTLRGMKENVIIGRRIPSGEEARSENLIEYDF